PVSTILFLNTIATPQQTRRAQGAFQPFSPASRKQQVNEPIHLLAELLPVTEPPYSRHAGKQVRVHVLHLDHLCQAHFAVGPADTAEFETSVRCLCDPE